LQRYFRSGFAEPSLCGSTRQHTYTRIAFGASDISLAYCRLQNLPCLTFAFLNVDYGDDTTNDRLMRWFHDSSRTPKSRDRCEAQFDNSSKVHVGACQVANSLSAARPAMIFCDTACVGALSTCRDTINSWRWRPPARNCRPMTSEMVFFMIGIRAASRSTVCSALSMFQKLCDFQDF
jgi:hypothetical protein